MEANELIHQAKGKCHVEYTYKNFNTTNILMLFLFFNLFFYGKQIMKTELIKQSL